MKATELLKEQHREIDELFERISSAEGSELRSLCSELAASLVGHSTIEKEIFYPASREAIGASFEIHTAFEEHSLVDFALQKLLSTDPGDESFHARVDVLKELVQHHVEEEEQGLLKQADGAMPAEQLEELGDQMETRFEDVKASDVEAQLAQDVAKSIPAPARRAPAAKPRKAAAKRPAAKRAPSRAEQARSSKSRRPTESGRKKTSASAQGKTGRTSPSRKPSRGTAKTTTRTGRKGGRSSTGSQR